MVEGSWIDRESHALNGPASLAEVIDFDDAVGVALEYAAGRDDTLVVVTADHETGGLAIVDADAAQAYVDELGGDAAAAAETAFPNASTLPPVEKLPLGGAFGPDSGELATGYGFLSVGSRPDFTGPSFLFRGSHSATAVPVFASGPAAEFVTKIRDNADLGNVLNRIILEDGGTAGPQPPPTPEVPENIIVVVADGVGLSSLSAGQYSAGVATYRELETVGLVATHAEDALVSDVGTAATALSTAMPALQGSLGGPGSLKNFIERAMESGMDTGFVTTADLADDAIAGLLTHEDGGAALQQIATMGTALGDDGLDVLFAGGRAGYSDAELDDWRSRGAVVEETWSSSADPQHPIVRLLADGDLATASERLQGAGPTMAELTEAAVEHLEERGNPFLLTIYADGARHAVSQQERDGALLDEMTDLDGALKEARAAAARIGDTAVVVVSLRDSTLSLLDNHYSFHKNQCGVAMRCGGDVDFVDLPVALDVARNSEGFSDVVLQGDFSPIAVLLQYAWHVQAAGPSAPASSASATLTPLLSMGPGTERLRGLLSLAEVGEVVADWATR
jgi:alkaline phosphatase